MNGKIPSRLSKWHISQRKEEDKFIREDGSVQWLSWEKPWYNDNGTIGGILYGHNIEKKLQNVKLPLGVILKMQPLVWRLSIPWQVDKVNASLCDARLHYRNG
jgi:hypothetical protein